ncbi:MAG: DNA topoisomerase, partial [Planctomycetia bacterium]|nr:DNA topoisomerase [Planctomycetia bacterium]
FKPEKFYSIIGQNKELNLNFNVFKTNKTLVLNKQKAEGENFIKTLFPKAIIENIVEKEITKYPSKLFSLDSLQNKMSKEFKMKPTDTLNLIQNL